MAAVVQEAHFEVREYIVGARAGASADCDFFPALDDYLRGVRQSCGLAVRLNMSPELTDGAFQPMIRAQLLRIIQEVLTNVRKHAWATAVDIRIMVRDGCAETVIEDDGAGFDPALLEREPGQRFGLSFMRERAEEVGGTVHVHSAPGAGTRVIISIPLQGGVP